MAAPRRLFISEFGYGRRETGVSPLCRVDAFPFLSSHSAGTGAELNVDRMLQDKSNLSVPVENRVVGDASIALHEPTSLPFGAGYIEAQRSHCVRLLGGDHALEGCDGLTDGLFVT